MLARRGRKVYTSLARLFVTFLLAQLYLYYNWASALAFCLSGWVAIIIVTGSLTLDVAAG